MVSWGVFLTLDMSASIGCTIGGAVLDSPLLLWLGVFGMVFGSLGITVSLKAWLEGDL
jgi:hypothetical protein